MEDILPSSDKADAGGFLKNAAYVWSVMTRMHENLKMWVMEIRFMRVATGLAAYTG